MGHTATGLHAGDQVYDTIGSQAFASAATDLGSVNLEINNVSRRDTDSAYYDNLTVTSSYTPSPVPEPSSIALLCTGLLGFAGMLRKRLA